MLENRAADDSVKIITIASGKDGVGKTNISLNLALSLLDGDRQVCLLDADHGLANVEVLLGLSAEHSIIDFIENRCQLENVLLTGPNSLKIIKGGTALDWIADLENEERKRLSEIFQLLRLNDALVIDTPAGISDHVLKFFEAASIPILVIVPELASITDAYPLLKAYQTRGNEGPVFILVNQVKSEKHAERVFGKFKEVFSKFLRIPIKLIGYVMSDTSVTKAVSSQAPFVDLFPNSPASLCLKRIAASIFENGDRIAGSEALEQLLFPLARPDGDKEVLEDRITSGIQTTKAEKSNESSRGGGFVGEIERILIQEGHLTSSQVDYARRVQQKLDTPKRILEIIKDLDYVRDQQIKETLYKNRTGIRVGSLLVELGYISERQLSLTLNQQRESEGRKRLGQILVESNYITEYELLQALSMNLGYPYIEPELEMLDHSLMEKASKDFFLTHRFLPLEEEEGVVRIVIADPLNMKTLSAAKNLFGSELEILIAQEKFIKKTIESYDALKNQKKIAAPDKNEIVDLVDRLIHEALKKQVSDIHIEPLKNLIRVRFRKDGTLLHHMDLSKDLEPAIVSRIKVMSSANITEKRRHQDGRILMSSAWEGEEIDIRVSFYITLFGEKVVMRILSKKAELYKVKDLGMGQKMLHRFKEEVLELPSGVVIITGPTGAGKTTTLYASINYCNNVDTNIITAEEPVEYVIEGISQCSINQRIGLTFEETLRHMLRQDPDIIILGEIRDKFSAESAIQAALTGHKVLTTFHTEDSIGGLLRLMNMDIETFLISSTVVCVVAQRLLKKVCSNCRTTYVPTAKDLRRLQYQAHNLRNYNFQVGSGCNYCEFTGYRGRVGVFEMLILNEFIKEAILNRKTSYEIRRISIETTGLVTLLEDGMVKAAEGITSIPEVIRHLPLLETPRPLEQVYRLVGEI